MAPRSGPPENWAEVRELQENFALLSRWWVALRAPPPPPVAKQAQGQAAIAIMAKYFLCKFSSFWYFFSHQIKAMLANIAKGTTDPRVEFISQVLTPSINFRNVYDQA